MDAVLPHPANNHRRHAVLRSRVAPAHLAAAVGASGGLMGGPLPMPYALLTAPAHVHVPQFREGRQADLMGGCTCTWLYLYYLYSTRTGSISTIEVGWFIHRFQPP